MPAPRHILTTLGAALALAFGATACGTDDAAKRDAKDAKEKLENSDVDKKVDKAAEDVDGY